MLVVMVLEFTTTRDASTVFHGMVTHRKIIRHRRVGEENDSRWYCWGGGGGEKAWVTAWTTEENKARRSVECR